MADSVGNVLKRLHPEDDGGLDGSKRARSNNGSPRPTTTGGNPALDAAVAAAKVRAAELKAKLLPKASSSAIDRLALMKSRVAAATAQAATRSIAPLQSQPVFNEDPSKARGGLNIGLHPSLLAESQQDTQRSQGRSPYSQASTTNGNRRNKSSIPAKARLDLTGPSLEELKENPYFDESLGPQNAVAKGRSSRQLAFNEPGKYIQQGAAMRKQAQLEQLKKKIAQRARTTGMEEELDMENAFLVPVPPEIEWWDEGLVNGTSYDAVGEGVGEGGGEVVLANLKIDTPDSIITSYIQHPVLIEPPQQKNIPAPKAPYLTSKENAKIRRQRRRADLQEQQAKQRLGLEPPPPPKVKKGNLMRVLGEEAVKDPTAVEARVNREIADRHQKHVDDNNDRALTKEQRAEKLARQQTEDAAKGIHVRVYRIDSLANGKHRYQISINAEQNALTGVCIMHPKLNVVVVEGGEHSLRNYDKLMQNRVRWTEMDEPRAVQEGNKEALAKWLEAYEEGSEQLKDLSLNKCELVFQGEAKQRAFRKWLGARVCESDAQAKDVLSRAKMENFWALAKSFKKGF